MTLSAQTVVNMLPRIVSRTMDDFKTELETKCKQNYRLKKTTLETVGMLTEQISENVATYCKNSGVLVKVFSNQVSKESFIRSTSNFMMALTRTRDDADDVGADFQILRTLNLLKSYTDYAVGVFIDQSENITTEQKISIYKCYNSRMIDTINFLSWVNRNKKTPKTPELLSRIEKIKKTLSSEEPKRNDYLKLELLFKNIDPVISNWTFLEGVLDSLKTKRPPTVTRFFVQAETLTRGVEFLLDDKK